MGSRPSKSSRITFQPLQATSNAPTPLNKVVMEVVALYNYPSNLASGATIKVGDRVNIITEDGNWLKVITVTTGQEFYIPSNYVAKVYHRWLFEGISREKAEELLMLPVNWAGAFMIRESQTRRGCYSLSIRRCNSPLWDSLKHYRITRLPNGWFYISPRLTFASLQEMVDHYSECDEGLCCLLKEPCRIQGSVAPLQQHPAPIIVQKPQLNWGTMDSSVLMTDDKEPGEESPVSLGLREAINSYLFMTEDLALTEMSDKKSRLKLLKARLQNSQMQASQSQEERLASFGFN
ncbi:src-like-adapter 2 [Callorhinchus milii]|uniref:Src like adaptor 2b n=1 Tax=Callorhinchus milii TaxID=7868 RepID=V9KWY8_CALMI|nr:src-like-adapter 2 [Callorhinchus milii]|eukprot:gi/632983471/ref/XP_007908663.1/ PREDICTED: src-like-adapter 2 [Callorhinchus milii]